MLFSKAGLGLRDWAVKGFRASVALTAVRIGPGGEMSMWGVSVEIRA